MAKKYRTPAHVAARECTCTTCDRPLTNATYEGEYCFGYSRAGEERWLAVFLTCRCGTINEVSLDITDGTGFMDTVDDVTSIPHRATKVTHAPVMAEEAVTI
jgi:hypothetical protein